MGEFDHIEAHRRLPLNTQTAHERIMEHYMAMLDLMCSDYNCDQEEAALRIAVVAKQSYEKIKAEEN